MNSKSSSIVFPISFFMLILITPMVITSNVDWTEPLLFNSEKNKWPPLELFKGTKYCPPQSPFIYLNSGMYFGRKGDIKSYLKKSFQLVENSANILNDDQATLQVMYVA
nr:unnamed protein product [Naegleria fowleri]